MTKLRALMTPEERERACAQRRAAYQRKRDQELAYAAAYREANKDRLPEYWREQNKKRKSYFDKYNEENAERIRARRLRWTEENRERISAKNAEWTRNNPEKNRLKEHKRRARKRDNGGSLSPDIVERLMTLQRARCACCGESIASEYHIDHIVPLALGGQNTDDNVQLLTPRCNLQKRAMHPIKYMQSKGLLL